MAKLKDNKRENSDLLINETPVFISATLASKLKDYKAALILQFVHYHTLKNRNIRDGKSWAYFSVRSLHEQYYPFLSVATLTRAIENLEEKKLLVSSNYNKAKYDRTKWYRVDYDKLAELLPEYSRNSKNQFDKIDSINLIERNSKMSEPFYQNEEPLYQDDITIQSNGVNEFSHFDRTYTIVKTEVKTVVAETKELDSEYSSSCKFSNNENLPEDKSSGENNSTISESENIVNIDSQNSFLTSNCSAPSSQNSQQTENDSFRKNEQEEIVKKWDSLFEK